MAQNTRAGEWKTKLRLQHQLRSIVLRQNEPNREGALFSLLRIENASQANFGRLLDDDGERGVWKVAGVAASTVQTIWKAHGLAPHRFRQFKLSYDPRFVEKLHDIVGLYVSERQTSYSFTTRVVSNDTKPCPWSCRSMRVPLVGVVGGMHFVVCKGLN